MTTKRQNWLMFSVALLVVCATAVTCVVLTSPGTSGGQTQKGQRGTSGKNLVVSRQRKVKNPKAPQREGVIKTKPTLDAAREDEKVKLSDAYKALLAEIQAVLDADDRDALIKIVRRMQNSDEWPDGIPSVLHKAAIDAMEWFGTSTAPELVGYLASTDADVVESVLEAMEDMLSDVSISDSERSSLLLNYAKVVKDSDALETMLMELDNMRPSTRAETVLELYKIENPALISQLDENIDSFFEEYDDVDVVTKEDIPAFIEADKKAHEEDPELAEEEEEIYGGDKDDD